MLEIHFMLGSSCELTVIVTIASLFLKFQAIRSHLDDGAGEIKLDSTARNHEPAHDIEQLAILSRTQCQ